VASGTLDIGRYRRYRFGISIGNNASISAPIPHTRHVCVTKAIVLCFDDAHQSLPPGQPGQLLCDWCAPSFVYKQAREEMGGVSTACRAALSIYLCVRQRPLLWG